MVFSRDIGVGAMIELLKRAQAYALFLRAKSATLLDLTQKSLFLDRHLQDRVYRSYRV